MQPPTGERAAMSEVDPGPWLARADLCRFLSACHCEPTPAFAEERLFDSLREAAARADPALAPHAERLGAAWAAADLQTLLVDYTRLFLGPIDPRARPYGSSWLGGGGAPLQDSTLDVAALYREGGFDLDEIAHELPDHVAVELEFLYLLAFREFEARRDGDLAGLAAALDLQRRFLVAHLGAWVAPFTAAVRQGAETAFYRELAGLTASWVARLQADLGDQAGR